MPHFVEDYYPLSVSRLKELGFLEAGQNRLFSYSEGPSLELGLYGNTLQILNASNTTHPISETFVTLDSSYPYLGGSRFWFLCPGKGENSFCNNRVGILYLKEGEFACRECHGLIYRLQNLSSKRWLLVNKAFALDRKRKGLEREIKRLQYQGRETKRFKRYKQVVERYIEVYDRVLVMNDLLRDKDLKRKSRKKQKNPYIREPKKSEGVESEIEWSLPDNSKKISNWKSF